MGFLTLCLGSALLDASWVGSGLCWYWCYICFVFCLHGPWVRFAFLVLTLCLFRLFILGMRLTLPGSDLSCQGAVLHRLCYLGMRV